jgi:predicted GH43/DUF377 family glycosyl hydrolase
MNYLINHNKRILYHFGIVIIFLVISIYQSGFYPDIVIEVLAESNTNEICDESSDSEEDFHWMIGPWVKYPHNPILTAGDYEWESKNVLNPSALVKDGKVYLFYRAQNDKRVSSIGLAISEDGYNFEKQSEPILVPTEKYEFAGVEDPRIVEINGTYYMTYTGWIYHTNYLCLAVSQDFIHWEKKGKILPDWPMASKSGAIVPEKINGKYYMYFGDTDIFIATSENLIDWEPQIKPVLNRRFRKKDNGERYFDSLLVEPGPTPIITEQGILLIYNGANFSKEYATGEVLFSLEDPRVVLKRTDMPVLEVDNILEEKGEVNNVVFSEGLVQFKGKWFLYFGMGDSRIGVAVADLKFVQ